jgi:hypothetical protein
MKIYCFNLTGLNFIRGMNIHVLGYHNFSSNYHINKLMYVLFHYNNLGLL